MSDGRPIRVLIAKPGLDGHDRGAKVVVKALMDAGMEVIYTGRHRDVDAIVRSAVEEDVDVIGLSILSGAHVDYCSRLSAALGEAGVGDVLLLVGGTIPESDKQRLAEMGFGVFGTGSRLAEVIEFVERELLRRKR